MVSWTSCIVCKVGHGSSTGRIAILEHSQLYTNPFIDWLYWCAFRSRGSIPVCFPSNRIWRAVLLACQQTDQVAHLYTNEPVKVNLLEQFAPHDVRDTQWLQFLILDTEEERERLRTELPSIPLLGGHPDDFDQHE